MGTYELDDFLLVFGAPEITETRFILVPWSHCNDSLLRGGCLHPTNGRSAFLLVILIQESLEVRQPEVQGN